MHNYFLHKLLLPFAWVYTAALEIRFFLYENDLLKSELASLPTFCVGNVILGGSGKTPFCKTLVEELKNLGFNPVILLRGYKGSESGPKQVDRRDSIETVGDEALMHLESDVPVVISRKRLRGIDFIKSNKLGDCVVMDDGLQHLSLKPQHKFLLLDVSDSRSISKWKEGSVLPAGYLREPLARAIARAETIILVNKKDNSFPKENFLNKHQFHYQLKPNRIIDLVTEQPATIKGDCNILCSIANPESFLDSVNSLGLKIKKKFIFPDHQLITFAIWEKTDLSYPLLVTSKDAVKLCNFVKSENQVFILEQTGTICDTQVEQFKSLLKEVCEKGKSISN